MKSLIDVCGRMSEGIALRDIKQYDPVTDRMPTTVVTVPASFYNPLAGHQDHCAKVMLATTTGKTDAPCTCGAP